MRYNKEMKLTKEQIEVLQNDLPNKLKQFQQDYCSSSDELPIDIFKISDRMGFDVYYGDIGNYEGAMLVDESVKFIDGFDTNKILVVNSKLPYRASVFTLAHELAHFLVYRWLNPEKRLQIEFREHSKKGERDETENFIDFIAASILMPEEIFKSNLAQQGITTKAQDVSADIIDTIAQRFDVEFEAAKRRISEVL